MDTLIHADIFFFITSIAVILLTILLCVILFYVAKIARNLASLSETVRDEGESLIADIEEIRLNMKEKVENASAFGGFVRSMVFGRFKSTFSKIKKAQEKYQERKREEAEAEEEFEKGGDHENGTGEVVDEEMDEKPIRHKSPSVNKVRKSRIRRVVPSKDDAESVDEGVTVSEDEEEDEFE